MPPLGSGVLMESQSALQGIYPYPDPETQSILQKS